MDFNVGDFVVGFDPMVSRGVILKLTFDKAYVYWFMSQLNEHNARQWNSLHALERCILSAKQNGFIIRP